jgi:hypothetical protein
MAQPGLSDVDSDLKDGAKLDNSETFPLPE